MLISASGCLQHAYFRSFLCFVTSSSSHSALSTYCDFEERFSAFISSSVTWIKNRFTVLIIFTVKPNVSAAAILMAGAMSNGRDGKKTQLGEAERSYLLTITCLFLHQFMVWKRNKMRHPEWRIQEGGSRDPLPPPPPIRPDICLWLKFLHRQDRISLC